MPATSNWAESQAAEALEIGTAIRALQVLIVGESRRMLAVLAADRGQHAESKRLIEQAAQAFEDAGDRWQLVGVLATMAFLACQRGEVGQALSPLRETLRLARDTGSRERMSEALAAAVQVLWQRGRAREVASVFGAIEALYQRAPQVGVVSHASRRRRRRSCVRRVRRAAHRRA